jgi:hypothetical protein
MFEDEHGRVEWQAADVEEWEAPNGAVWDVEEGEPTAGAVRGASQDSIDSLM